MFRITLAKARSLSVLFAALFVLPFSAVAASSIQLNFDTTIMETTGPSPLNVGDDVQGALRIATGDYWTSDTLTEDVFGVPLTIPVDVYNTSGDTWGWATGSGWSQAYPGAGVGLGLVDNYVLPTGSMNEAPGYASSLFPNLPSDGDTIDMVIISVISNDIFSSPLEKSFNLALIYDAADGVVTGTDLAGVDETKLLTSIIYGEFFAFAVDSNDITVWEATGAIGASPVPIPAAVWLFGSGLLGLIGLGKRRSV